MIYDNWLTLKTACLSCDACGLCKTRNHVVFGVGNPEAPIMFVGEGPGEQEDLKGEPFVGQAGKLLDDMLSIIDLDRTNTYIANIVKCRPPGNRDPLEEEQLACEDYLYSQISLIQPRLIVCLGRIAATRLIRSDFRITKEHGTFSTLNGIPITAIYHPSALLRDVAKRPETFRDLMNIRQKLKELTESC